MTPAQEREIRDKITEAVGMLRVIAGTQDRHGRKLDKLDARQDQTDLKLAGLGNVDAALVRIDGRVSALERWRYALAGAYTLAGAMAGYAANWLVTRR